MKRIAALILSSVVLWCIISLTMTGASPSDKSFIRYAEFNVCYPALSKALEADISSQDETVTLHLTELLAYLGARYGGDFKKYKSSDMDKLISQLKSGSSIESLTKDMKYYSYYKQVYDAVLGGFTGSCTETDESGNTGTAQNYGSKVCSPIADGFAYSHYDDFKAERTYGYKREHLGHDLLCAVGTPVVAVEDGIVEAMGWNQYGGWRIGIRSFDKKRYYYYAHLRKDRPYHCDLKEGMTVRAGDVIGYVGRTGYSTEENVNNIEIPHLHFGMELIFDESQKECDNEIWIDMYAITLLLENHRSKVIRIPETKEFYSLTQKKPEAGV